MIRIIQVLIIIFSCNNFIYSQDSNLTFVNPDNAWVTFFLTFSPEPGAHNKFRFRDSIVYQNDTLLFYPLEVLKSPENVDWISANRSFAEHNKRIYGRSELFESEFEILYDFNLEEGDTFKYYCAYRTCTLKVVEVDSITLEDGISRKSLILTDQSQSYDEDNSVQWIEGIGSNKYPLRWESLVGVNESFSELSCFLFKDLIVYSPGEVCDIISNNLNVENTKVSIYPNPFTDIVKVDSNEAIENYKVFDSFGKLIFDGTSPTINFEKYPKGIYYLKIQTKNRHSSHKLFKAK